MAHCNWFIFPRPETQAQLRLFCFPYAGGGASAFVSWQNHLPAGVELCAVQPPGRESRIEELPFTQLAPLVHELSEVIAPHLDIPFAFLGHSLGALVAFELARQLHHMLNTVPRGLFVSACPAPTLANHESDAYLLSDEELIERLRHYNGTPDCVLQDPLLVKWFLPLLRADLQVDCTYAYVPGPPLDCPISAFRGSKDPLAAYEEVVAWRHQTKSFFMLRTLPGDHFFIQSAKELFLQILSYDLKSLMRKLHSREMVNEGSRGTLYVHSIF